MKRKRSEKLLMAMRVERNAAKEWISPKTKTNAGRVALIASCILDGAHGGKFYAGHDERHSYFEMRLIDRDVFPQELSGIFREFLKDSDKRQLDEKALVNNIKCIVDVFESVGKTSNLYMDTSVEEA